ncbi:MAG: flagellar hook-length control protein FliK [Nisaea sp.]|nr:flagellar hook-length control protein FliK [Nisaea sp.]
MSIIDQLLPGRYAAAHADKNFTAKPGDLFSALLETEILASITTHGDFDRHSKEGITREYNDPDELSLGRANPASKDMVTEREDRGRYDNQEKHINNDYDDRSRAHDHYAEDKNQSEYKRPAFYEKGNPKVDASDNVQQKIDAPDNKVQKFENSEDNSLGADQDITRASNDSEISGAQNPSVINNNETKETSTESIIAANIVNDGPDTAIPPSPMSADQAIANTVATKPNSENNIIQNNTASASKNENIGIQHDKGLKLKNEEDRSQANLSQGQSSNSLHAIPEDQNLKGVLTGNSSKDTISGFSKLVSNVKSETSPTTDSETLQATLNITSVPTGKLSSTQDYSNIKVNDAGLIPDINTAVIPGKGDQISTNHLVSAQTSLGSMENSVISQVAQTQEQQVANVTASPTTSLSSRLTSSNISLQQEGTPNSTDASSTALNKAATPMNSVEASKLPSLPQDVKVDIKDTVQPTVSRVNNTTGGNILLAQQMAETGIPLPLQGSVSQRAGTSMPSVLPSSEHQTSLDVAANSGNKSSGFNFQNNNSFSGSNGAAANNQSLGNTATGQLTSDGSQKAVSRSTAPSGAITPSSMTSGLETNSATRSDGPSSQFSLSQNASTTNTTNNITAQLANKPIMQPATNQVFVQLTRAVQNGENKITIQLRPEELGRVEVKLDIAGDGRVKAMVMADKPETLDLLQRDSRTLERALQESGLKTDNNSLSFNLQGKESNSQGQLSTNNQPDPQNNDQSGNETEGDSANEAPVPSTAIGMTPDGAINVLA